MADDSLAARALAAHMRLCKAARLGDYAPPDDVPIATFRSADAELGELSCAYVEGAWYLKILNIPSAVLLRETARGLEPLDENAEAWIA